jgi:membrane peptidoglycan carboxypeptidase
VLATALNQGISVTARRNGSSPQTFRDRPDKPVTNSGGASCPACTLQEAITKSLNTTFWSLAFEVGPENVRKTMLDATGIPETWESGNLKGNKALANAEGGTSSAIGIGEYEMRPIDQAHGFATFAAGGVERDPYFVAKVADNAGATLLEYAGDPGEQVIDPDVANDVTYAIEGVAAYSKRTLDGGREVACKTGTQGLDAQNNSDAWMVGYTPSLSTAVWMGNDDPKKPIINAKKQIIYGSGLPGAIWQEFMNAALAGTPEENLPDAPIIKGDTGEGVPEPTPTPTSQAPAPVTSQAPATTSSTGTATTTATNTATTTSPTTVPGAGTPGGPPVTPPKPGG